KGVFTFIIKEKNETVDEWMMFTFFAEQFEGKPLTESEEGKVEWVQASKIHDLPMAEGDRYFLDLILQGSGTIFGTFTYTSDYELIDYRLDSEIKQEQKLNG
ncbi:MAG TPA: NUDIX hydrolase, partial [Bacillales bacterium]|nr:NUDIX hydrolase [Bacillales bacterium]